MTTVVPPDPPMEVDAPGTSLDLPEDEELQDISIEVIEGEKTSRKRSTRSFKCEFCDQILSNRNTYVKHLGRKHSERQFEISLANQKKSYQCKETGCALKFKNREELLHHLGKDHDWEIKEVTGTFDNEEDFEVFFQRVQKIYKTRFVTRHGKLNGIKRFYCNREGAIRLKDDNRSRKHIKRGTSKIGTFCTAHAIVTYHADGRVNIVGSVTHYNHALEGKFLPLLESERDFIRYYAQLGMNCREILETLHQAVGELEEDDPLRYIDYKTIRNTLGRIKGSTTGETREAPSLSMIQKINNYPKQSAKKTAEDRCATVLSDIVLEHTSAAEGKFDILVHDANTWGVKRPEGKVRHRVIRLSDTCPHEEKNQSNCVHFCKLCNCCAHLYKCNCGGATRIGKMCKHIHAVVLFGHQAVQAQAIEGEEYEIAQEVEEEHGLIDSYIEPQEVTKETVAITEDGFPIQIVENGRVLIVRQEDEAVTEGAVLLQGFEVIPETVEEPRINPEFMQFLEQSTILMNQLHQVATPENILQTCTIFQQLKMLVMNTDSPKIVKN